MTQLNKTQEIEISSSDEMQQDSCWTMLSNGKNIKKERATKMQAMLDEKAKVTCGEALFCEICAVAIDSWLEENMEAITERILSNYTLNPKKKAKK